jgi:dCMP deaminase
MATEWSALSCCKRKKVGALIVKDGTIISDGFNGTPKGFPNDCEDANDETHWYVLHAEANAMLKVARSTQNTEGSTLYVTYSPCKDCSKMIIQAGIKRVIYKEEYRDISGVKILREAGIDVVHLDI